MILHVTAAKYLHDYVIWVKFNDGIEGEVDLWNELEGEIFGPLKDKESFNLIFNHIHLSFDSALYFFFGFNTDVFWSYTGNKFPLAG